MCTCLKSNTYKDPAIISANGANYRYTGQHYFLCFAEVRQYKFQLTFQRRVAVVVPVIFVTANGLIIYIIKLCTAVLNLVCQMLMCGPFITLFCWLGKVLMLASNDANLYRYTDYSNYKRLKKLKIIRVNKINCTSSALC